MQVLKLSRDRDAALVEAMLIEAVVTAAAAQGEEPGHEKRPFNFSNFRYLELGV